ncbi:hypothetical protein [Desulfocurvus sp. DL9XJH121]
MKRYCAILLATAALLPVLAAGLVLLASGQVSPKYYWVETLMQRKADAAQAVQGRKMLLLGGSNVLFGLKARQIEEATGLPTVNMGVHGGLGADYMLHEARKCLRPGDAALMVMEYNLYGDDTRGINRMVAGASLARGLDYFLSLPWEVRATYLRHLTLDRLFMKALARVAAWKQRPTDTYKVSTVNRWGDETAHAPSEDSRRSLAHELGKGHGVPVFLDHGRSVEAMRAFIAWCAEHSVTVLATWPNTAEVPGFSGPEFEGFADRVRAFYAAQGVPMLGGPKECRLPVDLMYDTIYHPSDTGAELRTSRLIPHLKAALARN